MWPASASLLGLLCPFQHWYMPRPRGTLCTPLALTSTRHCFVPSRVSFPTTGEASSFTCYLVNSCSFFKTLFGGPYLTVFDAGRTGLITPQCEASSHCVSPSTFTGLSHGQTPHL